MCSPEHARRIGLGKAVWAETRKQHDGKKREVNIMWHQVTCIKAEVAPLCWLRWTVSLLIGCCDCLLENWPVSELNLIAWQLAWMTPFWLGLVLLCLSAGTQSKTMASHKYCLTDVAYSPVSISLPVTIHYPVPQNHRVACAWEEYRTFLLQG
jgi:hypothetical protein